MGVTKIRQSLATLYRLLIVSAVRKARERDHDVHTGSHDNPHSHSSKNSEKSVDNGNQLCSEVAVSNPLLQHRPHPAYPVQMNAKRKLSASTIISTVLGDHSAINVSNTLVIQSDISTPLKRTEIHLDRAEQVRAMLEPLVSALKNTGFDLHVMSSARVPATDIWLIQPLDDEKQLLLSCGELLAEQMEASVALQIDPYGQRQNDWTRQSWLSNAIRTHGCR